MTLKKIFNNLNNKAYNDNNIYNRRFYKSIICYNDNNRPFSKKLTKVIKTK